MGDELKNNNTVLESYSYGGHRPSFIKKGEVHGYRNKDYSIFGEVWPYRRDSKINQREGKISEIFNYIDDSHIVWVTK